MAESTKDMSDLPSPPSPRDGFNPGAFTDFYGLPSNPRSIYKTGKAWPVRTGPEAYRILREARPDYDHPIRSRWLEIGRLIYTYLDSCNVRWSSIDPTRFAEAGEEDVTTLHLWIGVMPETLAFEDAKEAAEGCKEILVQEGFSDVEVAFRDSVIIQSGSRELLSFESYLDTVHNVCSPFTPALGIQIAPLTYPHLEGTGAVYLQDNDSGDLLLLSACHVARPPPINPNNQPLPLQQSNMEKEEIISLGSGAFKKAMQQMEDAIDSEYSSIRAGKGIAERLGPFIEGENSRTTLTRKRYEGVVEQAEATIREIRELRKEVTKEWTTLSDRTIGYVVHAPAIVISDDSETFTRDWALIKLYRDKINPGNLTGNQIYIGTIFILSWMSSDF